MRDTLQRIVRGKRAEVAARRAARPLGREDATRRSPARDFAAALGGDGLALIAEFKRRSPSHGTFDPAADAGQHAARYQAAGAVALSVLTDREFFGGCAEDLTRARRATRLPVLRKDFVVERYQLIETVALGADAVLLIARILDDVRLGRLVRVAARLGLATLVEVHTADEISRAIDAGASIVGVNSRDLDTFEVDLDRALLMREAIPPGVLAVAESGVLTPADARRVRRAGFDGALVGGALMQAHDPGALLGSMLDAANGSQGR